MEPRYTIGTQFIKQGRKDKSVWTVTDILTTRDSKNDVVKIRYQASHLFCGQNVTDYDVVDTTIARGLMKKEKEKEVIQQNYNYSPMQDTFSQSVFNSSDCFGLGE